MSARILIVDDNPINIKLLAARLTHEYYIVDTATGGAAALDAVAAQLPDIILLDVQMPEMDGFEVCSALRQNPRTRHIPIIMVTALTERTDRVNGLRVGADDFISKPISPDALLARVRSLLRLKFTMDEWRLREGAAAVLDTDPVQDAELALTAGATVLYFCEDSSEHERLSAALASERIALDQVTTPEEVLPLLASDTSGRYEAVMLSLQPGNDRALQLIANLRAREASRNIPIVVAADDADLARAARALELGATDYIMRPLDPNELLARLRTQIRQTRTYRRLRDNYERSLTMAQTDPLTGAFNRRYLDQQLPRLFNRARAGGKSLAALYIDLDHFKRINDNYGHPVGDAVLKQLVERLNAHLRTFDIVARIGGEEFAVIMPETDAATAAMIGERLCHKISDTTFDIAAGGLRLAVTISVGVAVIEAQDDGPETLLSRADQALYGAKAAGRNQVMLGK